MKLILDDEDKKFIDTINSRASKGEMPYLIPEKDCIIDLKIQCNDVGRAFLFLQLLWSDFTKSEDLQKVMREFGITLVFCEQGKSINKLNGVE